MLITKPLNEAKLMHNNKETVSLSYSYACYVYISMSAKYICKYASVCIVSLALEKCTCEL